MAEMAPRKGERAMAVWWIGTLQTATYSNGLTRRVPGKNSITCIHQLPEMFLSWERDKEARVVQNNRLAYERKIPCGIKRKTAVSHLDGKVFEAGF